MMLAVVSGVALASGQAVCANVSSSQSDSLLKVASAVGYLLHEAGPPCCVQQNCNLNHDQACDLHICVNCTDNCAPYIIDLGPVYRKPFESRLTGTIATQLGNLHKLRSIQLRENALHGTIPSQIGSISALHILDLSINPDLSPCITAPSLSL